MRLSLPSGTLNMNVQDTEITFANTEEKQPLLKVKFHESPDQLELTRKAAPAEVSK
mgnify:FL=1